VQHRSTKGAEQGSSNPALPTSLTLMVRPMNSCSLRLAMASSAPLSRVTKAKPRALQATQFHVTAAAAAAEAKLVSRQNLCNGTLQTLHEWKRGSECMQTRKGTERQGL
jgi:hypothetical protein